MGPGTGAAGRRPPRLVQRLAARALLALALIGLPGMAKALRLEVRVEGLTGRARDNVLALLAIQHEQNDPQLTEARLRALHRQAPAQIRRALEPFGFYRVAVAERLEEPAAPDGPWVAGYRVETGPAVRIAAVDYQLTGEGAGDPAFPADFPMPPGAVLDHAEYERAKAGLRATAARQGFLDYRLTRHQVLVDPPHDAARIEFHLETGPRYRFGAVTFVQNLLNEELLQRYVDFVPGDLYDPERLLGLQSRLLGSEYFEKVEIVPRKDQAGPQNQIPIEIQATPSIPNKYRVGLEYQTDIGPGFSADWRRRHLNRWGHRLQSRLSVAPARSSLDLEYRIPVRDPMRDYFIVKPQILYYDLPVYAGWIHAVQVAFSTQNRNGWRRTLGLDFSYQDLAVNGVDGDPLYDLAPNIAWSKTAADDPILTGRGYRLRYSLVGAVDELLAETSYLSGRVQFKWIRRFAETYRLIARADLGATLTERVADLPINRRFYAGGDNSIRGWGFDVLGPTDPATDETLGGRYLAVGSLELERRLAGPWSLALFTDFGNAFDPDYESRIAQSIGAGVRWNSPIGQVRLDLAFAVSREEGGTDDGVPPARVHLVIGPDL